MDVLYEFFYGYEFLFKLLVAGVLGAIIGYEREQSHKPAGFRTHILVSLGATLFMVISLQMVETYGARDIEATNYRVNPTRVIAQIVTGISFLGAGSIIQARGAVHGLTTAASIWMMAAIGSAVGGGYYREAVGATLITFCVLNFLNRVSTYLGKWWEDRTITVTGKGVRVDQIKKLLEEVALDVQLGRMRRKIAGEETYQFKLKVSDALFPVLIERVGSFTELTTIEAS